MTNTVLEQLAKMIAEVEYEYGVVGNEGNAKAQRFGLKAGSVAKANSGLRPLERGKVHVPTMAAAGGQFKARIAALVAAQTARGGRATKNYTRLMYFQASVPEVQ